MKGKIQAMFEPYMDGDYCIVGAKEDPGDSLHRTMMYFLCKKWLQIETHTDHVAMVHAVSVLRCETDKGNYRRSARAGWWSDCDRMSRDQSIPLVMILGYMWNGLPLWWFFVAHVKRFGFFTNTKRNGSTAENHGETYKPGHKRNYNWKLPDIAGPSFMGIYIRAFKAWPLYPLLFISDFMTFLGAVHWRLGRKDDTDVLNHFLTTRHMRKVMPTPFARLIYLVEDRRAMLEKMEKYSFRVGLPLDELTSSLILEY